MRIYSVESLRRNAPAELRNLDDEALVREFSRRKNLPFEEVAANLGLKQRGLASEVGRQLAGGVMVEAPKIIGRIEQFVSREMPWLGEAIEIGAKGQAATTPARIAAQDEAELRNEEVLRDTGALRGLGQRTYESGVANEPAYMPDMRNRNLMEQMVLAGARGLGPVAMTLPAAVVPGGMLAATGTAFGLSQAEDTYQKLIGQGVSEDDARIASYKAGAIQGLGEAAGTYLGMNAFRAAKPIFGALAGRTTGSVAARAADTSIIRPAATAFGLNLLGQPATEVAQDVATSMVETAAGGKPEDLWDIAKQSAIGGAGLALWLGPLSFGSHVARSRSAAEVKAALAGDPSVAPERRAQIFSSIADAARSQGVSRENIGEWLQEQTSKLDQHTEALAMMEDAVRRNDLKAFQNLYNLPVDVTSPVGASQNRKEPTFGDLVKQQTERNGEAPEVNLLGGRDEQSRQFFAELRDAYNNPDKPSVWRLPVSTGLEQGSSRAAFAAGPQAINQPPVPNDMNLTPAQIAAAGGTPPLEPSQVAALRGAALQNEPRPAAGTLSETQAMMAAGPANLPSAAVPVSLGAQRAASPGVTTPPGAFSPAAKRQVSEKTGNVKTSYEVFDEDGNPSTINIVRTPDGKLFRIFMEVTNDQGKKARFEFSTGYGEGTTDDYIVKAIAEPSDLSLTKPEPKAAPPKIAKKARQAKTVKTQPAPTAEEQGTLAAALEEDFDLADKALDAAQAKSIVSQINKEELEAAVQGAKSVSAPRQRVTIPQRSLLGIRDAILRKSGKVSKEFGGNEQKIATAARKFADTVNSFMNASNALRDATKYKSKEAEEKASAAVEATSKDVSNALYALGQLMDNNAKNVEAIVRVVKDAVQRKLKSPGKASKETLDTLKTIDMMLSTGWATAKRETFMGERIDTADVSGQLVRRAEEQQEAGNIISQLEEAADKGFKDPKKISKLPPYKGLAGVLQYLSFNATTPMGKLLGAALREAITSSKNAAKVKFVDEGNSRYDPKTNTVFINRGEQSAEVVLHEAFHAALQWYVHQNPKAAEVQVLQRALDRALKAEGLTGKAKEVQDALKALTDNKRNLDAVLELVSYNATLNDFRRAMQELKSEEKTNPFWDTANKVWQAYKRVIRRLLGVPNTVADDILGASMSLLEKAAMGEAPAKMKGKPLEATVKSGKQKVSPGTTVPESPEAAASGQNIMMSKEQLSKYTKTLLPRFTLTQTLFNQLGWQNWMSTIDKKAIVPLNKFIQKETPKLAQAVSWFNSHYGLESNVVESLVGMKDARRGGTALSEKVAGYIANLPVEKSKALLSYMNDRLDFRRGLRAEPEFTGGDTYMQRLADQAIDNWWKYATEGGMSPKDRAMFAGTKTGNRWVGGLKFTEGFVFPESVAQVASASFGSRKLRELKSRRIKDEVGTDNIRFRTTSDGDPILDDKFVGIYNDTPQLRARLQAGESLANIMPDEFISADLFVEGTPLDDKGQAMLHDPAFTWDLQKKGKAGFQFSAHYDAREAYSVKKALDVANAFQNTMTLLANSYASNNFAKSLYDMGTTKVGKDVVRDGSAVVFDDLDQLNQALNGEGEGASFKPQKDRTKWTYEIKPDKVIRISSDEAKSERAKGLFRNRNQWVLVPKGRDGEVYGALSGKIVNGSVWAAIQDASDRRPVISVPYANDIMRFFKSVKTVYMPPTWVSNVATNVMFAIADDIPLSTLPHAARLYAAATVPKEIRQKMGLTMTSAEEELMVKILNSNALLGNFASDEIKKSITDAMVANLNGPENSLWSRMVQMAGLDKARIEAAEKFAGTAKDKTAAINEFMTEWYAAQDNIFRVASVLNYLGKASDASMDINDAVVYRAGKHARDAFLDYDIDSKAIRIMRQTAFPFISFPYAATKLVGRLVVHAPWKLVNIYAAAMIADAMLSAMADDDDEETRRTGPERFRERLLGGFGPHAYFRIPLMGDSENPVYYHVGKYLFASSLFDASPNGFMGISWFPSAISPGGPFVSGILATVGGIDPFDGKPISEATATDFEKVIDRLKYLQSLMTPNLPFVNAKETEKFIDIAKGRTDLPAGSTSLALARYLGLRMYNYNVDAELEKQDRAAKAIEADYKKAINKLKRKTERMEDPDWDEFYEEEEKLLQRMEKRIAELRGEEYEEE